LIISLAEAILKNEDKFQPTITTTFSVLLLHAIII